MIPADKLCPDDFWGARETLVVQDPIDVVPVFWVPYSSFLSLLVFGLQFLQPQSHAANASPVKTFED